MSAQILTLPSRTTDSAENGTVAQPPSRKGITNADRRGREHLSEDEIGRLLKAARDNRHGERDALMILMCFRHALRVSELVALEWNDVIDLERTDRAKLHVRRRKNSESGTQPLEPDEVIALRKLRKADPSGVYVFTPERGSKFSSAGFRKMLTRVAEAAGLSSLAIHPHMLRHSTGFELVNRGLDTRSLADLMGHKNMQNTRRYTAVNAERFRGIWRRHK